MPGPMMRWDMYLSWTAWPCDGLSGRWQRGRDGTDDAFKDGREELERGHEDDHALDQLWVVLVGRVAEVARALVEAQAGEDGAEPLHLVSDVEWMTERGTDDERTVRPDGPVCKLPVEREELFLGGRSCFHARSFVVEGWRGQIGEGESEKERGEGVTEQGPDQPSMSVDATVRDWCAENGAPPAYLTA